jgi:hypothetical protein
METYKQKILPKIQTPISLEIMQFDVGKRDSVKENAPQNLFFKNIPEEWDETKIK